MGGQIFVGWGIEVVGGWWEGSIKGLIGVGHGLSTQ